MKGIQSVLNIIKIIYNCPRNVKNILYERIGVIVFITAIYLRGGFLESRVFFAKTAQNLATKPSRKNVLPPFSVLKVFQKYLRRKTEFYWIFYYVMRQNIAKYKEG